MTIPSYTMDGILPPFIGSAGPGDHVNLMSPYAAGPVEVVERFATSTRRTTILKNWLDHRAVLRSLGIVQGFQWLDGSFAESQADREPNDLDLVTFFHRPPSIGNWRAFWFGNQEAFFRTDIKQKYNLDAFFLDMDDDPEDLVLATRYFLQLFSHQRETFLWMGMVQVRLEDADDDTLAMALLTAQEGVIEPGEQA